MHIFAIRHTSVAVDKGICYGQSDVPLSETFEEEALTVLDALGTVSFDSVYTSPLSRCRKLAKKIIHQPVSDSRLLEFNFGEWEMKPWDDLYEGYGKIWMDNYLTLPTPGGESFVDMKLRIKSFLSEVSPLDRKAILLITHSGVIRLLYNLLQQCKEDELFSLEIPFGSLHAFGAER